MLMGDVLAVVSIAGGPFVSIVQHSSAPYELVQVVAGPSRDACSVALAGPLGSGEWHEG